MAAMHPYGGAERLRAGDDRGDGGGRGERGDIELRERERAAVMCP